MQVTLSAAVINVEVAVGDVIDPERLLADAEAALDRAKQQGRNRVERVDGYSGVVLRTRNTDLQSRIPDPQSLHEPYSSS